MWFHHQLYKPWVWLGYRCLSGITALRVLLAARDAQKCPFEAIQIINLPKNLETQTTHRYGPNSFKLHRCGMHVNALLTHAVSLSMPL